MTDQDRSNLVYRWFDRVWCQGDISAIDEMMAPTAIAYGIHDAEGNPVQGPEGFKPVFQKFRNSFPDIRITVEDCLVKGDKVAARCLVQGTHTGAGLGVAATQSPVKMEGMCIVRIEDNKIMEAWNNFDFMSLYQQVGLVPAL